MLHANCVVGGAGLGENAHSLYSCGPAGRSPPQKNIHKKATAFKDDMLTDIKVEF